MYLLLIAGSMLHAMFSGRFDTKPDEDGSYFIDRDGTHKGPTVTVIESEDNIFGGFTEQSWESKF